MAEFTLLKIQLDESSLTANAPFSDGTTGPAESPEEATEGGGSGIAGKLLTAFVGVLVLAAIAFAVKRKRGAAEESDEELVELDDIDV